MKKNVKYIMVETNKIENMTNAEIFIESNSAHLSFALEHGYDVISKHNALQALQIQKKSDEQFFRSFLLDVVIRQSQGEALDLEKEFNERFKNV